MSRLEPPPSRRDFLMRSAALAPAAALGAGTAHAQETARPQAPPAAAGTAAEPGPYRPTFFNPAEWTFLQVACDHLIPADEHGPGALETGVPEFIDQHMRTPFAAGEIWYMQGPFIEAGPEFGYQGRLPLRDLLRVGMASFDQHCRQHFDGRIFADLTRQQQHDLLKQAEGGKLDLEGISSKSFFTFLLNEVRYGYFADPSHGGNRGMGGWKMIGYPGVRADYLDWVGVRDRPYPLPPVNLAGQRG